MAKIEFIYDIDCPNVEPARKNLEEAVLKSSLSLTWQEWDRNEATSPEYAKKYGSPTILVSGKDVAGQEGTDGNCCRIYDVEKGNKGVPPVSLILKALQP